MIFVQIIKQIDMLLTIHPTTPDARRLQQVVDCLKNGGIIIYPTDTVYGIGCDITNAKAVEKVCKIKGVDVEKHNMSFICSSISNITDYARPLDNEVFRMVKAALPGPYTFIFEANTSIPKLFRNKKKQVGIRVPDNTVCLKIVELLGNPLLTTSLKDDDDYVEYTTNPELIHEKYEHLVDIVIDGGIGGTVPSTIIDCTTKPITVVREGAGSVDELGIVMN